MNELIEKLFDQAKVECFKMGSKPATTVGYDELERFAELIVKECVVFLKDTLDDHFAAEQLEEHFGVESE